MKTRILKENNYKAIWFNGKTIHMKLDEDKPMTELSYPEFYDIKITNYCKGNCPWCYMNSKDSDTHFNNIVEKAENFFGSMTKNQRPFQVAIGGGEPTEHPKFFELLNKLKQLGIEPNYTTNGMWVDKSNHFKNKLINKTKDLCGGVAVSCHPHLKNKWKDAANLYYDNDIMLNFHIIISDRESSDYFRELYDKWKDKVDYFVLLPYSNTGRGKEKDIDWEYLVSKLPASNRKIAFGANFYNNLKNSDINVSIYEPESLSKFLDMSIMTLYRSSFKLIPVTRVDNRWTKVMVFPDYPPEMMKFPRNESKRRKII